LCLYLLGPSNSFSIGWNSYSFVEENSFFWRGKTEKN
jgi:hypothetical protein